MPPNTAKNTHPTNEAIAIIYIKNDDLILTESSLAVHYIIKNLVDGVVEVDTFPKGQ